MHLARLALAEGAVASLLCHAQQDDSHDRPDTVVVTLGPEGLDVTYLAGPIPVAGEGA